MAPTKSTRGVTKQATAPATTAMPPLAPKGLLRRATSSVQDQNVEIIQTRAKRKADQSFVKNDKAKRSALGNLTNNVKMMSLLTTATQNSREEDAKHQFPKKIGQHHTGTQVLKETQNIIGGEHAAPTKGQPLMQHKVTTRATARNAINAKVVSENDKNAGTLEMATEPKTKTSKAEVCAPPPLPAHTGQPKAAQLKQVRRISNEFNKTEESLYMSALEDISSCESIRLSGNFEAAKRRSALLLKTQNKAEAETVTAVLEEKSTAATTKLLASIPEGVEDFDKLNWNDPFQVSHYAMDIFNYLKEREELFHIDDYMSRQLHLTKWMRSLLVDWMVEVQETFELNHETLYLAVKIVDIYLTRVVINKEKLQLLGAAALFIACKFDERTPPLIEDFLYICDGAYKHDELVHMEMKVLRTIDYDLGIPLSYRFLRRYARCAKVTMATLTLARYILELSLMDYATIGCSDSKLACAALFIALRLDGDPKPWTPTLEYFTSYKLEDFAEIVPVLNVGLHCKPKGTIKTIRSKYSHKIFHEVAKIKLMSTEQLFENNLDLNVSMKAEAKNQST